MSSELEQRAESLLKRPPDARPLPTHNADKGVVSLGPATAGAEIPFSVFDATHAGRALELTAEMMHIANDVPGDEGLARALARAEEEAERTSVELAQYALAVFITHYPRARKLPIPSLEESRPELVVPSPAVEEGVAELGAVGKEAALNWFREDPSANDHHIRWHQVYPFRGRPDPNDPDGWSTADRQGELFLYMHEQMLARYDTERLAAGLPATESLSDYRSPVPGGYRPEFGTQFGAFSNRPVDTPLTASRYPIPHTELEKWDRRFRDAIVANKAQAFAPQGRYTTPDRIGCTLEANVDTVDRSHFGDLHNTGHMIIAMIPDPQGGPQQPGGVMRNPTVAIRDPIFWRWHRHVDDIHAMWQDLQPEQSFGDAPQDVSPAGVIVCKAGSVTGDAQQFGDQKFGGSNFSADPAQSGTATDTLNTFMRRRNLPNGVAVDELDHDDFFYFIRAKNDTGAAKDVTVRIFLVPREWAEQRRCWIELDKFKHSLPAGNSVIARSSKLASVVRKPARRPSESVTHPPGTVNYCDCGWPYHLLLPRGTREGMKFRLLVMFTDWAVDNVDVAGKCSSMSFCGKLDANYPDKRPMGYPFDRKWPGGKIGATIATQKTMTARDLTIQWIDPPAP